MLVQYFRVKACVFFARKGVDVAADGVHLNCDLLRASALGAFEHHVLNQVRGASRLRRFSNRAGIHPDPHRNGTDMLHLFINQPNAVWQSRLSNHIVLSLSCTGC